MGAEPATVFDQQPQCHRLLFPVLSFDGCVVNEVSWGLGWGGGVGVGVRGGRLEALKA